MTELRSQRRSRSIAMSERERDEFLTAARVGRVATVGAEGIPHVAPLWFIWDGTHLWLNSLCRSQRWTDLQRNPAIAVVIDGGDAYDELHGVEIEGVAEVVGEVPRGRDPHDVLTPIERAMARKYAGQDEFDVDGRHAWLRVTPTKVVSWDFRKARDQAPRSRET